MLKINLKANNSNEKFILKHLENNASEVLSAKINAGIKTLAGCWAFIVNEARKKAVKGCACIPDVEVFGWAMHYFEEDSIEEGKADTVPVQVVSQDESKIASSPKKTKTKQKDEDQLSMLDLFG